MSQITTLEGGQLSAPRRVVQGTETPAAGGTVDPSYREAFIPLRQTVDSQGARMAAQLEAALHGAAHVGEQIGNYDREDALAQQRADAKQQAETDRQLAKDDAAQRHTDVLDRGIGAKEGRVALAKLHDDLKNGNSPVALTSADVPGMVDQWTKSQTQGMNDAQREGFVAATQASADSAHYLYRDLNVAAATKQTLSLAADHAAVSRTPEALSAIADNLRESKLPGVDDDTIASKVYLPAMHAAAESGDQAQFDAAKKGLGARFADDQERLEFKLNTTQARQQTAADKSFGQSMAAEAVTRQPDFAGPPTPIEVQRKMIDADSQASPEAKLQAHKQLDAEAKSAEAESKKYYNPIVIQQQKNDIVNAVASHMMNATATGGAATLESREFSVKDLDGKDVNFPTPQVIEQATASAMDQIARTSPPDRVLADQVRLVADNHIKYAPWANVMEAGASTTLWDMSQTRDAGGKPQIPVNAKAGAELHDSIRAINPQLADRLVTDPQSRKFYDVYDNALANIVPAMQNPNPLQMEAMKGQALAMAAAATAKDRVAAAAVKPTQMVSDRISAKYSPAQSYVSTIASNPEDVAARIAHLASTFVSAGTSPDAAIKLATDKIRNRTTVFSNSGYAIDSGSASVPTNIDAINTKIAADYAAKYGKQEGVAAKDLHLEPDEASNQWLLVDSMHVPVRNWQTEGYFTLSDFYKMNTAEATKATQVDAAERSAARPVGTPRDARFSATSRSAAQAAQSHGQDSPDLVIRNLTNFNIPETP